MKYFLLSGLALCLVGCGGGDSDDSIAASATVSAEEFKSKAKIVRGDNGVEYSQMEVASGEDITIQVAQNDQGKAIFTLASSDEGEGALAEKMVVSGKLTIK